VENFNKCLNKTIRVATIERKNWKEELYNFLLNYRATPHTTTGRTPSELLFKNQKKLAPILLHNDL
jgi:UTP:GlnB (protein PII) uridylyltransferase